MTMAERNFIEFEGTVSPPDILTDPNWADFVFVSTLRHPLARIISALKNDKAVYTWSKLDISTEEKILHRCEWGVFHCHSNYYIRMFAGHPGGGPGKGKIATRETLDAAKANFLRYSCVILQEDWKATEECLASRLGFRLQRGGAAFNVNGHIAQNNDAGLSGRNVNYSKSTFLARLDESQYERLLKLNELDIEFYEWAKELIQSGYFINTDT